MLYAIISDIHANIDALDAVFERIDEMDVETTVCLGDVVGYNAMPNECVEKISERGIQTILGNHDAVACGIEEPWGFNPVALTAAVWTREQLTDDSLEWLRGLPDALNYGPFAAAHGAPKNHNTYLFAWEDILSHVYFLDEQNCNLCFIGHTHTPAVFCTDGALTVGKQQRIKLESERVYFINPGSVGQPRDDDLRAAFGVLDTERMTYEMVRVSYDVEKAAKRVREAQLPRFLAERLMLGR